MKTAEELNAGKSLDRCDQNDPVVIPEINDEDGGGPGWMRLSRLADSARARGVVIGPEDWIPSKPLIKCKCGKVGGIGLHHVHADGRVTNSYYDTKDAEFTHNGKTYSHVPGCGWHVYIKLDGYDCGEFPPEGR